MMSDIEGHTISKSLVRTMEIMAAVDREISPEETSRIAELKSSWPVFKAIGDEAGHEEIAPHGERDMISELKATCSSLPHWFGTTAYVLAEEVAAADGRLDAAELSALEAIKHHFDLKHV